MTPVETRNLLLVEDEPLIALAEKKHLERFGYAVTTVGTGEKAIEVVSESRDFDLILMDIDLGRGIDGTQAAEAILADRDIPIVFLSSHTDPDVVRKTEKITSYGYVVKSSSTTVLDASIKMAFKLFAARREAQQKEEFLRRSEEKYRLQFMHMNSYNSMYEVVRDETGTPIDFRFVMVNEAYEEYVGKGAAELVGRTLREVFPRTERYWIDAMAETVTTGTPRTFENFSAELDTWIEVNLFTPQPDQLVMTSSNVTERKRIERELRESVERYNELVSCVSAGIYIVYVHADERTEFEYVSDRWCVIHGVRREDVLADSRTVDDLVHPDDQESFVEGNRRAIRDRVPFTWDGRFFTGDGRLIWLSMESAPAAGKNGDLRWYGVIHDITERKTMESELTLHDRYLEAVLETTSDGFWVVRRDTEIIRVNPAACRISGYDKDELEGMQINDLEAVETPTESAARLQRIMTNGSETFETRHRRKDGSIVDIEVSASRLDQPEGPSLVCFIRDITERKHHEQQLRDSQALNRALFEQALISIFIADMSGRFIDVNDTASRTTGFSRAELMEMTVFDLNEPGASLPWKEALLEDWRRWKPGEHYTRESVYTRKDGTRYPVLISTGVIQYGETRAVAAAVMDISEQKEAERAVQRLLVEKETLLDELRHRIKNNINTMASLLSLHAHTLQEPTAIAALQDAQGRVQSLGTLYDHLYAAPGGERGSLKEYLEMLILREIELFPVGKRVATQSELDECWCPAATLSTVGLIANELITNAMKYAFDDHPAPLLRLTGRHHDGRYRLTVADNGPGVPQSGQPSGSSGFGLMVITTLTEQLDGTITFENDLGTRATLEFPIPGE